MTLSSRMASGSYSGEKRFQTLLGGLDRVDDGVPGGADIGGQLRFGIEIEMGQLVADEALPVILGLVGAAGRRIAQVVLPEAVFGEHAGEAGDGR